MAACKGRSESTSMTSRRRRCLVPFPTGSTTCPQHRAVAVAAACVRGNQQAPGTSGEGGMSRGHQPTVSHMTARHGWPSMIPHRRRLPSSAGFVGGRTRTNRGLRSLREAATPWVAHPARYLRPSVASSEERRDEKHSGGACGHCHCSIPRLNANVRISNTGTPSTLSIAYTRDAPGMNPSRY